MYWLNFISKTRRKHQQRPSEQRIQPQHVHQQGQHQDQHLPQQSGRQHNQPGARVIATATKLWFSKTRWFVIHHGNTNVLSTNSISTEIKYSIKIIPFFYNDWKFIEDEINEFWLYSIYSSRFSFTSCLKICNAGILIECSAYAQIITCFMIIDSALEKVVNRL